MPEHIRQATGPHCPGTETAKQSESAQDSTHCTGEHGNSASRIGPTAVTVKFVSTIQPAESTCTYTCAWQPEPDAADRHTHCTLASSPASCMQLQSQPLQYAPTHTPAPPAVLGCCCCPPAAHKASSAPTLPAPEMCCQAAALCMRAPRTYRAHHPPAQDDDTVRG